MHAPQKICPHVNAFGWVYTSKHIGHRNEERAHVLHTGRVDSRHRTQGNVLLEDEVNEEEEEEDEASLHSVDPRMSCSQWRTIRSYMGSTS